MREEEAGKQSGKIDHPTLIEMLSNEFPEIVQAFDEIETGLLHLEMASFARTTKKALDEGRFSQVQKYFVFMDRVRKKADPDVENAIDVSFIENLAYDEVNENRLQAIRSMPTTLREILLRMDPTDRWKY